MMKKYSIIITIIAISLLAICVMLFYRMGMAEVRLAFAEEQIKIFNEMEKSALKSTPEEAIANLEYTLNYYPSGTKQQEGTFLDKIVEKERKLAISNIISYLKEKTKDNLGDDPEKWIKKYKKK